MDLKGEVSQKIKSAIKAKLVELGQNVDDELPDYIMVMIANKRTKSQMDSDLSLFLGSHSDQFTSWLHQVLNRLKEVTLSTTSKGETQSKAKKRSQEEPELETLHKKQKRGTEEKKKVKDDKRKKKDDKLLKDDSKKKKRKHHDKEKKKEDKNGKQDKDKNKGELVKVDDEKGKPLDESLDKQEISVKELKDTKTEELQRKSENHNPLKKPAEEALPDYESDEEILQIGLDDEKPDNFTTLETTEVEEKAPVEPVKELIQASSPPKEPEVQNRLIKLKRSVIPKAMEPIECNQTKEMEKPIKTMARVRPSIMSRLGSIVQPDEKPNRIIRQSTSPEGIRKPSLHSVPSSIIKVKARPRPITSNQATKTLIMKAVVDATKSIISAEKAVAKPVSTDEEIKKPRSIKDRLGYRIQSHEVNQIQDNDVIDVRTEERQNKMKEIFRKIKSQLPTGKSESQVVVNLYNSDLSDLPKVLQVRFVIFRKQNF
ncbi:hypothetical protein QYM36_014917 [Artemia franciscana]|uniref:Zinc finger CCCH domain-containing protein 14 n=1 Tax=Artemia franciscana TaxID=6661 RepID=A0AA88KU47_ARTSF|nr:hypothetical protein QYM36_014917 [Artemia franciscana]